MEPVIVDGLGSFGVDTKAIVTPKKSIQLVSKSKDKNWDLTFKIGDKAEYGSYNLHYIGTIVAIGPKTVTIAAYPGTYNERKHQLKLSQFAWRNYKFNLEELQARNAETRMSL